jgi:hypothetical protein
MGAVSKPPIATATLSNNTQFEVICACCYCDRARLAATKHSNGCGDGIDLLLLWPSSTHRKIYDIKNKVS